MALRSARTAQGVHSAQTGAAAVEFALTLTAMLAVVFAIVGFGFLLWAQQSLTRMAADGARVAMLISQQSGAQARDLGAEVRNHVLLLQRSSPVMAGLPLQGSDFYRCEPCGAAPAGACARVSLRADLSGWPLLRLLGGAFALLGGDGSLADGVLRAHAVVRMAQFQGGCP